MSAYARTLIFTDLTGPALITQGMNAKDLYLSFFDQ